MAQPLDAFTQNCYALQFFSCFFFFFPSPETLVVFSPFIYWSAEWIISAINQALSLHFLRCCRCYEVQRAIKIKLGLHYHLFYRDRITRWIFSSSLSTGCLPFTEQPAPQLHRNVLLQAMNISPSLSQISLCYVLE